MTTWTAVVTAAPTPGTRTITFIDGPPEPPIGTKVKLETVGPESDLWPKFCPNCAAAFHEDGTFTPFEP